MKSKQQDGVNNYDIPSSNKVIKMYGSNQSSLPQNGYNNHAYRQTADDNYSSYRQTADDNYPPNHTKL